MELLHYEVLVRKFEEALLTQLRGHGCGGDYLNLWVPDADPVKSIVNMAEAAQLSGQDSIQLRVLDMTMDQHCIDRLRIALAGIGDLDATKELDAWLLVMRIAQTSLGN